MLEPGLLRIAEEVGRRHKIRASLALVIAGLVGAVLPRVEKIEFQEVADRRAPVELQAGAIRKRGAAQGICS